MDDSNNPIVWLAANDVETAPFTGTDSRVIHALAATWEVYAYSRNDQVLVAIVALLLSMQPKCVQLTKKLIARSMDWSDVDRLWPIVESMYAGGRAYGAGAIAGRRMLKGRNES